MRLALRLAVSLTLAATLSCQSQREPRIKDYAQRKLGVVEGRVVDHTNKPIAGVEVAAQPKDLLDGLRRRADWEWIQTRETGFDGSFRLEGLPFGQIIVVVAHAQAKEGTSVAYKQLKLTRNTLVPRLELALLPGSRITGKVIDAVGRPIDRARVFVIPDDFMGVTDLLSIPFPTDFVSYEGDYFTDLLPKGKYTVWAVNLNEASSRDVDCDGLRDIKDLVIKLSVTEDSSYSSWTSYPPLTQLQSEKEVLAGRVNDDTGAAVAGLTVQLRGFSPQHGIDHSANSSAPHGSFRFEGLLAGIYDLMISDERFAPFYRTDLTVGPTAGDEPLEIVLQRAATVKGRVMSRPGGAPIGGAKVRVVPPSHRPKGTQERMVSQTLKDLTEIRTAADGSFVFERIPPGRLHLRAEAPGYSPDYTEEFEVLPGGETMAPSLSLGKGASVAGQVLTPDREPAPGAKVRIVERSNDRQQCLSHWDGQGGQNQTFEHHSAADDEGKFRLERLPAGKVVLSASHDEFASREVEMTLAPDEARADIGLRLMNFGSVRVELRDRLKPVPNIMVQLFGPGTWEEGRTGNDGTSLFENIVPGRYLIEVTDLPMALRWSGPMPKPIRYHVVHVEEMKEAHVRSFAGQKAKIYGKHVGLHSSRLNAVRLRRPGHMGLAEVDPLDWDEQLDAVEYYLGSSSISTDGRYFIPDVPDGEYILETHFLPGYSYGNFAMGHGKLVYQHTVKVEAGKDLEWNIEIKTPAAPEKN